MLEQIVELHKQGKLEEAERRYRELLAFNPDDPEALHLLGMVRRQRGDFSEGMAMVEKAVALVPGRANYHLTLGGMQLHARLFDRAKASFQQALQLNPNLKSAYSALGQIAMLNKDDAGAESQFKLALLARPDDPQVLTSYGNLHFQRGDIDLALKYLARAAELAPNDAAAQASLGRAYLKKGMFAFAEQALRNALGIMADFPAAQLALAESLVQQQRQAEGAAILKTLATASGAVAAHAHFGLGDMALAHNDLAAATQHFRDAVAAEPSRDAARGALARCLLRQNQVEAALDVYRERLRAAPEDASACLALGGLEALLGRELEAAATFRAGLERHPDQRDLRLGLASALEAGGDLAAAENEALLLPANDAGAGLILARAALRRGDANAARRVLDGMRRQKLSPSQARQRAHLLGHVLDRMDLCAEALSAWLEAQALLTPAALPTLGPVPVARLDHAELQPLDAGPAAGPDLVFLLGAPGSGVERVAALLGDQTALRLLDDRLRPGGRHDWLSGDEVWRSDVSEAEAQIYARRYRRALDRLRIPAETVLVDWLPLFDARSLPVLAQALPGARYIVVGGDPRDMLLNWLAYGCPQAYVAGDADAAANWLAAVLTHLGALSAVNASNTLALPAATDAADLPAMARRLADFLGLDAVAPGANYARAEQMLGGLAPALPAGHHQRYSTALAAPFQTLTPFL